MKKKKKLVIVDTSENHFVLKGKFQLLFLPLYYHFLQINSRMLAKKSFQKSPYQNICVSNFEFIFKEVSQLVINRIY